MPVGTKNFPTSLDTVLELVEVTNDASTALNGALTIGATTVTVDSTSLFPSSGIITIDSENISYTGKTATTFTGCTRAAESTTAAAHDDNATVELLITAALPNVHAQSIIAIETKLGIDSSTPTANKVLRATGTGTSAWGAIVNADIDASAAIAVSKLAALTASRLPVLDASGFLSASPVTATEAGYLSGVTSAIQTQLDGKQTAFGSQTANFVYAGPASGGAASPAFRALVAADIPSHNQAWSTITSTPTTLSGYGITDAQGLDSDLTAIAGLSPSNDDVIQRKAGAWTNRTPTQLTADLIAFTGDSGSGGVKGLVPAPSAGDAAASKFLKADGTWATAGGSSGITIGSTTITSGTTTRVLYNNAGVVGEYAVTGTGNAVLSASPTLTGTVAAAAATFSGTITQTSASATAFESGPNGGTNPVFRLVNSTASAATGLSITGNAAGSGVTLTALSSGTNENILLVPKGTGGVQFPNGAQGTPAIYGANSATTGFYFSSGAIAASTAGTLRWYCDNSNFYLYAANYVLNFARGGTNDVGLMGLAAGVLQVNGGSSSTQGTVATPARTPSQITADQNNYTPGVGLFQRWSSDASRNVTGLAAGQAGQIAYIWNVGSFDIVLVNESASSTAANRFTNSGGADITLAANRCVFAQYDATSSRWRAVLL